MSLLRLDTRQTNYAIDDTMASYFTAMNQQDYNGMGKYLYPTSNDDYLLSIAVKAQAVHMQSIRLRKVYPALVHGDLAIVGFETSTSSNYEGEKTTIRETNTFFFRRKDDKWYIAKPEDLNDQSKKLINDMIDEYKPILKENMAGGAQEQQEYNKAAYAKLKGSE